MFGLAHLKIVLWQTLPNTSALPRLLMADDHHLILDALQAMMKNHFDVLAVDSSQAFINAMDAFQPDVAVLDISMPGGNGFVTARKVLERRPSLLIVFLSMYADSSYVDQAAQVGARAYLSKCMPAQDLISAIRAVLEGGTLLRPGANAGAGTQSQAGKPPLTARQRIASAALLTREQPGRGQSDHMSP